MWLVVFMLPGITNLKVGGLMRGKLKEICGVFSIMCLVMVFIHIVHGNLINAILYLALENVLYRHSI